MNGGRLERIFRMLVVAFLYAITAAIVLDLFVARWGYRDEDPRFGFEKLITYEADRPFVYRVLVPAVVNGLTHLTPEAVTDFVDAAAMPLPEAGGIDSPDPLVRWAQQRYARMQARFGWSEGLALERLYTYFILFVCAFGLQVLLRKLGAEFFALPAGHLDVAPVIAMLFLPLTFQQGGYLFDFSELLLVTAAFLLLVRQRWLAYYGVFMLAMLNKETSILLAIGPWALYRQAWPLARRIGHTLAHLTLGASIVLIVNTLFRSNPGGVMEWHLQDNLWYFATPSSYFVLDDIYAPLIGFPVFFHVALVALAVFLAAYRWREKPEGPRILVVVYVIVLTPLFLIGGWRNEVRVFDVAAPAFYLLAVHTLHCIYANQDASGGRRG